MATTPIAGVAPDATVSLSVPEQMRFQLEMLSRLEHGSCSEVLLRQLESLNLGRTPVGDQAGDDGVTLADLWSPSPAQRFKNLAVRAPGLLSGTDQRMLAHIRQEPKYWEPGPTKLPYDLRDPRLLLVELLEEDWSQLTAAADLH